MRRLSLENKFNLGFGAVLLVLIAIGLLTYWSMAEVSDIPHLFLVVEGGSLAALIILLIGAIIVKWELRQRKQAEAALQEREAFFRATFDEAPIGIMLTNLSGKIVA